MPTRAELEAEDAQLASQLADPDIAKNPGELARLAKRKTEIGRHLELMRILEEERGKIAELEAMDDPSLAELAIEELAERRARLVRAEKEVAELERPKDPDADKNVIVEIRAGAGGDEASLFARDLFAMYTKYAERRGWQVELLSSSPSEAGGFKEVIFKVAGDGAFGALQFEGGTHRVQRIPVTESGGRIHTSTATVAALAEAEEAEMDFNPDELRIDVYRSSGPGGQSVNTTDSAVRITHVPTGLTVSVQDEKSQHKNRAKALSILRTRLRAKQQAEAAAERGSARRAQIGTGDRSEKIRTYNVPQDRVTDHRIKKSVSGVTKVLEGGLDPLLTALEEAAHAQNHREDR